MSRRSRLAVAVAVAGGVALGLGAFTFGYAKGYSYLTKDPAACANCHVMTEHFDAWNRSSHRAVAVCNDCHTPHNFLGKYAIKAQNGFWHSFYFTTGNFPDPLRITPRNRRVTEGACRYCHAEITEAIDPAADVAHSISEAQTQTSCIRCHRYVGHLVR
jgi:cytochrome c nitrite reductase small subunit